MIKIKFITVQEYHFNLNQWLFSLEIPQPDLIYPGNQQGDLCLRQAIADYLYKYRSVHCTAAQIIVGAGIEYLLMILNVLFDSDSLFAMENPGYPKVYQTITNCGRTVEPINVTDTGIDIATHRQSKADIVYVTQYQLCFV